MLTGVNDRHDDRLDSSLGLASLSWTGSLYQFLTHFPTQFILDRAGVAVV